MHLDNVTQMQAAYTQGVDKDGREHLVVVVKGTFLLPTHGGEAILAQEQVPPVEADSFFGEPGFSATKYESDFAPIKPRCDVLLHGSAYAPQGKATDRVDVGIRIGKIRKVFSVVGKRFWYVAGGTISATSPEPFDVLPISYDVAFGGSEAARQEKGKHDACLANPVGTGFYNSLDRQVLHNKPLPNTEELDHPVKQPDRSYVPMAFGPVGRGWQPRVQFAGTYDQDWIDRTFPFLPPDFQDDFYQCAPADQQTDYLMGGEQIDLLNLTPAGRTSFSIPRVHVPVVYFYKRGAPLRARAVADTLMLEPDLGRFTITWRCSVPLRRNIFEIAEVLVGERSRAWWRARELGKTFHASLDSLVHKQGEEDD
ncbi:MAG: DUF2169 domain-containing protein [Pseudomonadota bacterium]